MTRRNADGIEQKTLQGAAKCDHFRTFTPRDRGSGSKYEQSPHYETGCVCTGNHRKPCKFRVAEQTQNGSFWNSLESEEKCWARQSSIDQKRYGWLLHQVQVNHPFFFSIVSFHVCLFPRTSHLSPPGNLVGMKSQHCICLSRISTCPSGLSDSWTAEHPEIQDRLTAH